MSRRPVTAALLVALASVPLHAAATLAGVEFDDCSRGSDGSITCDTRPTGNTLLNDVDARFGLLDNASPGWSEFEPYQGLDQEFGDNGS